MNRNIKRKILDRVKDPSASVAHFVHSLSNDYSYIDDVLRRSHTPGLKPNKYQRYKLWYLLKTLEKHKPMKILEFGGGSSTIVFSDYADRTGAKVICVDNNPEWAERIKSYTGKNTETILASVTPDASSTPPTLTYDIDFEDVFDLVLIDGPGGNYEGIGRKKAATTNALRLNAPKLILVDYRKATVDYMRDRMQGYACAPTDLFDAGLLMPGYRVFSVFSRKSSS